MLRSNLFAVIWQLQFLGLEPAGSFAGWKQESQLTAAYLIKMCYNVPGLEYYLKSWLHLDIWHAPIAFYFSLLFWLILSVNVFLNHFLQCAQGICLPSSSCELRLWVHLACLAQIPTIIPCTTVFTPCPCKSSWIFKKSFCFIQCVCVFACMCGCMCLAGRGQINYESPSQQLSIKLVSFAF